MKKMIEYLRNDVELQQFRKEWKERFTVPFPTWNYDCFDGMEDYKQRIKTALESDDDKKICETCIRKACKARIPDWVEKKRKK